MICFAVFGGSHLISAGADRADHTGMPNICDAASAVSIPSAMPMISAE